MSTLTSGKLLHQDNPMVSMVNVPVTFWPNASTPNCFHSSPCCTTIHHPQPMAPIRTKAMAASHRVSRTWEEEGFMG